MEIKQSIKLTLDEIQNIKYFFLLAMEDYLGDKEELMRMANVDDELLTRFFGEQDEELNNFYKSKLDYLKVKRL